MKLDFGIIPDQTFVNQTDITQRDIEEVDDFLDKEKGKKEEVLHQLKQPE